MGLTLTIENYSSLPGGGPLSVDVSGEYGIDIGRDRNIGWTLPDPTGQISERHCEIRYKDGVYFAYDISTSGVFLKGASHRIKSPHRLRNGDRLVIGQYIIAVEFDSPGDTWPQDDQSDAQSRDHHPRGAEGGVTQLDFGPKLPEPPDERHQRPLNFLVTVCDGAGGAAVPGAIVKATLGRRELFAETTDESGRASHTEEATVLIGETVAITAHHPQYQSWTHKSVVHASGLTLDIPLVKAPPPWRLATYVIGGGALLIAVVTLIGNLIWGQPPSNSVVIPALRGIEISQAQQQLEKVGLTGRAATTVPTGDQRPNTVIDSSPRAGQEVPKGSSVDLTVAVAPPVFSIPDVIGKKVDEGRAILESAGLRIGSICREPAETAGSNMGDDKDHEIIATDPGPNAPVTKGQAIKLTYREIVQLVVIPQLTGTELGAAEQRLTQLGLTARRRTIVASGDQRADTVINSSPEAGQKVPIGSAVDLTVAIAPPPIKVPDVIGKSVDQGRAILEGVGLKIGSLRREPAETGNNLVEDRDNEIVGIEPHANVSVPKGAVINLTYREFVLVPQLTGAELGRAEQELTQLGLTAHTRTIVAAGEQKANTVINSSPRGGQRIPKGSSVDLTVAVAPPPLRVPDVIGKRVDQARAILQAAGLEVGSVVRDRRDSGPPTGQDKDHEIETTDPAPNMPVPKGQPVILVYRVIERQQPTPNPTETGSGDLVRIVEVRPPAGTRLARDRPARIEVVVDYTLTSLDESELTINIGELAADQTSCQLARAEFVGDSQAKIARGRGRINLALTWWGDTGERNRGHVLGTGYLGLFPSMWVHGPSQRFFAQSPRWCYPFGP